MAIDLSAVVDIEEYAEAVGLSAAARKNDTRTSALLKSMTRVVEKRMGLAAGMLLPQNSETFTFDAEGGRRLWLRDNDDLLYPLRTITADSLKFDTDADASFDDYTWDFDDAWVVGYPRNAAAISEPYTAIDLVARGSYSLLAFPDAEYSVQIVGNWGYAANSPTTEAIKQRIIGITRELIETHHAGASWTSDSVEMAIAQNSSLRSMMMMIEQEYSHRLPVIA